MYEMVEGFHNDGWWAGVVSAVPPPPLPVAGDCRPRVYKVTLPAWRQVLEFEETDLRPHRMFKGGRWVPAAEVDNGSSLFSKGNTVEVSRSAKCFGESWVPATVLKVIGATNFLVQYKYVGEDRELVTEIVDTQYVRPSRTMTHVDTKYKYSPSSHVEVFHEDCWRPGVILEVSGSGPNKEYVVKLKSHGKDMDDVECVDVLTVENTQLRPRFAWVGKKWIRGSTEKPANGRKLTSRKRPISELYNGGDEISDKPGSCPDKRLKNTDVVSQPIPPLLSEETMKLGNAVLALESQLARLPLMAGSDHLSDFLLSKCCQLEQSSSQMIIGPSLPQSRHLQASLFGSVGQLKPLPQGPVLRVQSLNPDFSSTEGSTKVLSDQEKQSTDQRCYVMASAQQKNINVRSFVGAGTDLSRKTVCVSFQTTEALGGNPETPKKRTATKAIEEVFEKKAIEEANKSVAISGDLAKPKHGDHDVELPNDVTPDCGIFSEINALKRIELTQQKYSQGSQERSGIDDLQQGGYVGALGHGSTTDGLMIENSVLSTTSILGNPSNQPNMEEYGSKITKSDNCAESVEQGTGEDFCQRSLVMADNAKVHLLPSAKSREATGHDDQLCKDSTATMVECVPSSENLSIVSPGTLGDDVLNLLHLGGNIEVQKKVDIGKENHQGNAVDLLSNGHETQHASIDAPFSAQTVAHKGDIVVTESSTKKVAANGQLAVSQQGHSLALVEYFAAESSQYVEKSEIIQLSSVDMSNSTETEPGNSLTITEGVEGAPMSKYVERRHDSCCPLSPEYVTVHESIMHNRLSESLDVQHLPSVKTSPMWAIIEAMEIFSKVPQRPNFHQFRPHGPELLEGMALGLMFSFANLAESINRLNIQDNNELFEEKMKCLSFLEENGFDIGDLRSRLERLLHIKNSHDELQDAVKTLEEKISHKETYDRQLGTQIRTLTLAVCDLELHAYLLRNIRLSAILRKINNATEISKLKTEARELERSYLYTVALV